MFLVTIYRLYNRLDDGRLSSTINSQALRNCARLLETKTSRGTHRPLNNVPYSDQLDNHNGSIRQVPRQRLLHLRHRPLRRELHLPLLTNETHLLHVDTSLSTTTHKYAPFTYKVSRRLWLAETTTFIQLHTTYYLHLFSCFSWLDYHIHATLTTHPNGHTQFMHTRTFLLRFERIHLAFRSPITTILHPS